MSHGFSDIIGFPQNGIPQRQIEIEAGRLHFMTTDQQ